MLVCRTGEGGQRSEVKAVHVETPATHQDSRGGFRPNVAKAGLGASSDRAQAGTTLGIRHKDTCHVPRTATYLDNRTVNPKNPFQ